MLVVEHDKEEAKRIAEGVAQGQSDHRPTFPRTHNVRVTLIEDFNADVENKKTTLIEIVQQLGEYINDEDPILRGKAVSFLTSVIKALPPKFLSRQQIQVLTSFFCDRIEDGGAVAGLDTLQKLDRFTKGLAAEIAQSYVHFEICFDTSMQLEHVVRLDANLFLVCSLISKTYNPDPNRSDSKFTNCSTS